MVKGQGRIPALMVLGDVTGEAWFAQLLASLPVNRSGLGVATPGGVSIGTETVRKGPCTAFQGGVALISDPQVEMAVICVGDERVFETGLPVDRFDVLVLAGSPVPSDNVQGRKRWRSFAQSIAPMCSGPIIVNQECSQWLSFSTQLKGSRVIPVSPARNSQISASGIFGNSAMNVQDSTRLNAVDIEKLSSAYLNQGPQAGILAD